MSQDATGNESFGVLVGWKHSPMGARLGLQLQCTQSTRREDARELDLHHVVMTRQQATILANYLFKITEQTPPRPRRGLLRRWFGL